MFAATAANALANRSITVSTVAVATFWPLIFDTSGACERGELSGSSSTATPGSTLPVSADSKFRSSCFDIRSTATAFANRNAQLRASVKLALPSRSLLRSCLTSVGASPFVLSFYGLAYTDILTTTSPVQLPNRSLRVRHDKRRAPDVATTTRVRSRNRISPPSAGSSTLTALRRFTCVRQVHTPTASFAHPLAGSAAF